MRRAFLNAAAVLALLCVAMVAAYATREPSDITKMGLGLLAALSGAGAVLSALVGLLARRRV